MSLFKRKVDLETQVEQAQEENVEVKKKAAKVDKLSASLQEHLKDNHIGLRLYHQLAENWK